MSAKMPDPTEKEIREICEDIQAGWNETQEFARRYPDVEHRPEPFSVPVISLTLKDPRHFLWEGFGDEDWASH